VGTVRFTVAQAIVKFQGRKCMKTFGVALLGAGRMGMEHARNMISIPNARLLAVADPFLENANRAVALTRAERAYAEPEAAIHHAGVDAVVIVTPTATHAELIEAAARAGKAIFCEKPVALDLGRTQQAMHVVNEARVPFQIGFNRRFDPPYAQAKTRIASGEIGQIEQYIAVMRDPAPPPTEYLRGSGGMFVDQSIHDLDCARFLVGEVEEVCAWGAVLIDPAIGQAGDIDTGMISLRFKNGALGVLQNSRRSVFGYDVRTEVFGAQGKFVMDATPKTPLTRYGVGAKAGGDGKLEVDHYHFFIDRFRDAYRLEMEAFFKALEDDTKPTPGTIDALESLRLAVAATRSLHEKRTVRLEEIA
jgi:myo-inositol 2-dehydrogenase/D-chiro-inositol 1-dehydrogenase